MSNKELQLILAKVEEVKALFVFAQRVLPYMREIILFVQETTPLLQEMSASLEESFQKMPFAVQQLDKISATTETATTSILDRLDEMLLQLDESMQMTEEFSGNEQRRFDREKRMILQLAETLDGKEDTRAARVDEELSHLFQGISKNDQYANLRQMLARVQTQAYEIMNLLQVQDITTQQIMAANTMIESVQKRLCDLISQFGDITADDFMVKRRAFDPRASFEDKSTLQALADAIMHGGEEPGSDSDQADVVGKAPAGLPRSAEQASTQAEIDRLIDELKK